MFEPTEIECREIIKTVFGEDVADNTKNTRFKAYLNYYCSVVCPISSKDIAIQLDTPALKSHTDVLNCVKVVFHDPNISFNSFVTKIVDTRSSDASLKEKEHVAKIAIEVAFAVNCVFKDYCAELFMNSSSHHVKWQGDDSFLYFIEDAFRSGSRVHEHKHNYVEMMKHKRSLKAWKLIKRYGIKIKNTDNLLEHLHLDRKTMTLQVFHQVAFLRAHLAKTRQDPIDLNFEESLKK